VSAVVITHIGGPTVLIEVGGWRILTDPTFDRPGGKYSFGWGTSSRKTAGPALDVSQIGKIDVVLLTHDQHADNLDNAGRALLPSVETVVTTHAGARRLSRNAHGLANWERMQLTHPERQQIEVIATPCRHGPRGSKALVGDVIGFALKWAGQVNGVLWVSGDTVFFEGMHEVGRNLSVSVALLHLGAVQFPVTGGFHYTMTARDAVRVSEAVRPAVMVPVHYEGWSHFHEGRAEVEGRLGSDASLRLEWLTRGVGREFLV
jgi:L-ascorbate metabolism protein UlaG (beta-lactamase superfamily)